MREEAASSLHAYLDSLAAHRWDAACSYVSDGVVAELKQFLQRGDQGADTKGCPEILAALNGEARQSTLDDAADADVASLRVQGDRAFVIYRAAKGQAYAMPMAEEDGMWKVAALAATPML